MSHSEQAPLLAICGLDYHRRASRFAFESSAFETALKRPVSQMRKLKMWSSVEGEMIFEFDSDGFLTDRSGTLEAEINRAHNCLLARARQINRDCHELLFAADVRNRDPQGILVATLFMRALEHYQATLILLGRGLIAPARVALRATLESVFTTRAVAADEGALKAYVNNDLIQRLKLIRKAKQHDHTNLEELREALTNDKDNISNYLDDKIKSSGAKELKIEELSKRAGMHEWYTTIIAYPVEPSCTISL